MPDDVQINAPGPNGEKLTVDLKQRTIGFTVKDLLPILMLLVAFGLGVFIAKVLFLGQERGQAALSTIATQVDTALAKQNEMLAAKLDKLEDSFTVSMQTMGQWLEMLNHNLQHPDQALPLRAPARREEHPAPRDR